MAHKAHQAVTSTDSYLGLLIQVLLPPLLGFLSGMKNQQKHGWFIAQVAPAMGLVRLKHQAISRLYLVYLACDPVLYLALQAENELLPQVDDGTGPGARLMVQFHECTGLGGGRRRVDYRPHLRNPASSIGLIHQVRRQVFW